MADIEKIIKGLEQCVGTGKCQDCVYGKEHPALSCKALLKDALELLKEQQEKIEKARMWLKADGVDLDAMCDKLN